MRLTRLGKSFSYAWRGLRTVAREEQNFRIQLLAAACVFVLAAVLRVRPSDIALLTLVTGFVLMLELLNSLLERLVDAMKPRLHPYVAEIKNIAAGAVFVAALTAVAVAGLVFVPYLYG